MIPKKIGNAHRRVGALLAALVSGALLTGTAFAQAQSVIPAQAQSEIPAQAQGVIPA